MKEDLLAEKIKFFRKKRGVGQFKLALLANVHYETLKKVETGKTKNPSFDFVCKIAIALRVDLNYFSNPYQFQILSDIHTDRCKELWAPTLIEMAKNK